MLPGVAGQGRTLDSGETLTLRRVLLGSAFRLGLSADRAEAGPHLTVWGRVAGTQFSGKEETLTLDGDVLTGVLGIDSTWDHLSLGLAVTHSRGYGGFNATSLAEHAPADLETALTSLSPYLWVAIADRLDVWGLLGYGRGELTLAQEGATARETDTALAMGAFGGRGILLGAPDSDGFQLAARTDAMLTRTTSEGVAGLAPSQADVHRLRLILEGSRVWTWAESRVLTPAVEVGLRHDWGDTETGFGLELGGRMRYADPGMGLTVEGAVRGLLVHEDRDYREWGASGSVRFGPGAAGQGLSLTVSPTWGTASSGPEGLWSRQTTAGLARTSRLTPVGRLNAEVAYGLPAPIGTGLLTPYAGAVLVEGADHTYRVGTRLQLNSRGMTGLTLNLEVTLVAPAGPQPVTQDLRLQATWGIPF